MLELINQNSKCSNKDKLHPFLLTNCELLQKEYNITITDINSYHINESTKINDINFVTTLAGSIQANLIFSFSRDLAKGVLDNFSFIEYDENNFEELLLEVVSEFLNIVVGRAMAHIDSNEILNFSPPIEFTGESKLFHLNSFDICKVDISTHHGILSMIFSTQTNKEEQ